MFATPGPNNAMLTASGIKFGFKKTLPHLVGIPFGHVIQITLVCFGLGSLFSRYPIIQFYLKWICFFYLIYLGWKIIGSFSGNEKESGRPLKLYEAALFQFINPKAWVVALTAATAFFPSNENFLVATAFVALTAPFVCFPSICLWAAFGSSIKLVIKNGKVKKIIEYLLAILLLITDIIIVID
jgi:threonine/homoserine/homoserine lactone efflux protein